MGFNENSTKPFGFDLRINKMKMFKREAQQIVFNLNADVND